MLKLGITWNVFSNALRERDVRHSRTVSPGPVSGISRVIDHICHFPTHYVLCADFSLPSI